MKNLRLMDYDKRQLKELLSNYGIIDILFIDGPGYGLREYAWSLQNELVIARDLMNTPEQATPNISLSRPWEAYHRGLRIYYFEAGLRSKSLKHSFNNKKDT